MSTSEFTQSLSRGTRVRLIRTHPKKGQECTIIEILPNPSGRPENQWYDVRFDDFSIGRFLERYLEKVVTDQNRPAA